MSRHGTSTRMIELHYGTLVEGAHGAILARVDAHEQAERQLGGGRLFAAHETKRGAAHLLASGLRQAHRMGTSVAMIDRTYGHLARDSEAAILAGSRRGAA